jgi:hypothetical protein
MVVSAGVYGHTTLNAPELVLMVVSNGLRILYSFLYKEYLNDFFLVFMSFSILHIFYIQPFWIYFRIVLQTPYC